MSHNGPPPPTMRTGVPGWHRMVYLAAVLVAAAMAVALATTVAWGQDGGSPAWILQNVSQETSAQVDTGCWPAHAVSLNQSEASTSASWDDSCGGGSCRGRAWALLSWEEPPPHLLAGTTLAINGSFEMKASQSCGSKSFDASLSASYRSGSQGGIIQGWPFVQGWSSEGRVVRGLSSLSWTVPEGRDKETLYLLITARGPGGNAVCAYQYRWGRLAAG